MGRSAVEHPIGIPSAGFVNCSSNIHSAAGCEAPYRDETQVLANPPHSLYGFWKDRQNRGINAPFIPAMLFSEIHTTSVRSCWGNQNGGKTSENLQESASRRIRTGPHRVRSRSRLDRSRSDRLHEGSCHRD